MKNLKPSYIIAIAILCMAIIFVGAFFAEKTIAAEKDEKVVIDSATVLSKETKNGNKYKLRSHYLTLAVDEKEMQVKVPLHVWSTCQLGDKYSDFQGSSGTCFNNLLED